MARTPSPDPKSGRVKLSLTQANYAKLFALAKLDGKPAAVIVREVVEEYLASRAADISDTQAAKIGGVADGEEKFPTRERA